MSTSRMAQINYDIHDKQIENPSYFFRRFAFRMTESVWIMHEDRIPWNLLDEWTQAGVTWHEFKFDLGESQKLLALARISISREIEEARVRADESMITATETLQRELTEANGDWRAEERARTKYDRNTAAAQKRLKKLADDLANAATVFGLEKGEMPIQNAREQVNYMARISRSRAREYARMTAAVAETPMAVAAQSHDIPAGILADYAEERTGEDMSAARQIFNDTPATPSAPTLASSTDTERPYRSYTVRTRNGVRTRQSNMTTAEAQRICRELGTDSFSRDLGNRSPRYLSETQTAWIHVLAVELSERATEETTPVVAPAAAQVTAPPVPSTQEMMAFVQNANDTTEEISTEGMAFNKATNTIRGEVSSTELSYFPSVLILRSHRTGSRQTFRKTQEAHNAEGELQSCRYECGSMSLVLIND